MLSQTALTFLGLASTALATYSPEALKSLRDLSQGDVVRVEVRQAQSTATTTETAGSLECTASALSIITDAPTPPSNLVSYFESFVSTADLSNPSVLCQITQNIPQSVSSDYSSYDQQASSWFSKHSSEIQDLASKCGDNENAASVSQVVSALDAYAGASCTSSLGSLGASATGAANGGSSVSTALAARPTGIIAGAVAAAGFLGAAVAL
ncbi:hypothetical protein F4819DRAFT_86386 [Hypoxylon fuscum]|nr:hypothetical protein F4819DRAFT_86386 [Hypoxylon fuscum]